ncbi:MAG: TetR/AcrR family transcriptional regulator C-terminal domain-containing protein, partial [Actinomycetota bacterium]
RRWPEGWTPGGRSRTRCVSVREVLSRHPWAVPLMESRTNPGPELLGHHDAVLGCLRRAGFSVPMVGHAYALLDNYVYGFALQESSLPATGGEDMANLVDGMLAALEPYPNMVEFTVAHVLAPGYDFRNEFDFGLDLILDGLTAAAEADPDSNLDASPTVSG